MSKFLSFPEALAVARKINTSVTSRKRKQKNVEYYQRSLNDFQEEIDHHLQQPVCTSQSPKALHHSYIRDY